MPGRFWDRIGGRRHGGRFYEGVLSVRLFIGNLPYSASEAELRAHFSVVAEPAQVIMPVDRETGRPRGFAFVEFAERSVAEQAIQRFDQQPFMGRNLAVSEARAREDRPPPRSPGGFGGPRPGGGSGYGGPRTGGFGGPRFPGGPSGGGGGLRDRTANFGPPAPPKRLRGKKGSRQEDRPRGPIKERSGGRIFAVDDLGDDEVVDLDNVATRAAEEPDSEDQEAITRGDQEPGSEDQETATPADKELDSEDQE